MTDREKAIVMAYTGICMLVGDKFQIFHKYVEDIMGKPVWTHEIVLLEDEIKEKSKADFMELCADESHSENPNKWIPVSEGLPKENEEVLVTFKSDDEICVYNCKYFDNSPLWKNYVIAWMPLPQPYEADKESEI